MNYYILTGTSQGFGRAIARALLHRSDTVVVGISRSNVNIDSSRYHHIIFDLSDVTQMELLAEQIFKHINAPVESIYLINNAASTTPIGTVGSYASDEAARHLTLNAVAPVLLSSMFIQRTASMTKAGKGIINISSGASRTPYHGWSCYCTSKAALEMFTQCLKLEHQENYTIATYDPGVIDTAMQKTLRQQQPDTFRDAQKFRDYFEGGKLISADHAAEKFIARFFNGNEHTNQ
jgi:benzil reductase ((S)-benzoin forming)